PRPYVSSTSAHTLPYTTRCRSPIGFGYRGLPFRNSWRINVEDIEVAAKYRFAAGAHYAGTAVALVRLPTGATDILHVDAPAVAEDRESTRVNSSHGSNSDVVFC